MEDDDKARYLVAAHAMQAGVKTEHGIDPKKAATSGVQNRVGVNSALVQAEALVRLLISKGLFTEAEYWKAMADAMETEQHRYEKSIATLLGRPDVEIKLV